MPHKVYVQQSNKKVNDLLDISIPLTRFRIETGRPYLERFVPGSAHKSRFVRTDADGVDTSGVTATHVHALHRLLREVQCPNDQSLIVRTAGKNGVI